MSEIADWVAEILPVHIKNVKEMAEAINSANVQEIRPTHFQCSTFTVGTAASAKLDILQEDPLRDEAQIWVSSAAPASVQLCHSDAEANDALKGNVTGAVLLPGTTVPIRGTGKLWAVNGSGQPANVSIVATRRNR